jgi:hypothetical protein
MLPEPEHSTAGSTRFCVKGPETTLVRPNSLAWHGRPLKSHVNSAWNRPARNNMERVLLKNVVFYDAQLRHQGRKLAPPMLHVVA